MTRIRFAFDCPHCHGKGVRRPKRPGVDWPEACRCKGRRSFTQYELARLLREQPQTIVRIHELRSRPETCERVLDKLAGAFL